MSGIALVKEAGTHPPIEGWLARYAKVHAIRSLGDLTELKKGNFDLVIVNAMRTLDGSAVLKRIQGSKNPPIVMLTAPNHSPESLAAQIERFSSMRPLHHQPFQLARAVRVMGISQEALGRILGVSSRTAHRWLKGARPRPRPQFEQLARLFRQLEETFDSPQSIRSYLRYPNPGMGGETPLSMLIRGEFDRVEADLQALQEGAYE